MRRRERKRTSCGRTVDGGGDAHELFELSAISTDRKATDEHTVLHVESPVIPDNALPLAEGEAAFADDVVLGGTAAAPPLVFAFPSPPSLPGPRPPPSPPRPSSPPPLLSSRPESSSPSGGSARTSVVKKRMAERMRRNARARCIVRIVGVGVVAVQVPSSPPSSSLVSDERAKGSGAKGLPSHGQHARG